jgi:hypothetical protein
VAVQILEPILRHGKRPDGDIAVRIENDVVHTAVCRANLVLGTHRFLENVLLDVDALLG